MKTTDLLAVTLRGVLPSHYHVTANAAFDRDVSICRMSTTIYSSAVLSGLVETRLAATPFASAEWGVDRAQMMLTDFANHLEDEANTLLEIRDRRRYG